MLVGSVLGLWPFGRAPSEDALGRRDLAELVSFADQHGILLADAGTVEGVSAEILGGWSQRGVTGYGAGSMAVGSESILLRAAFKTAVRSLVSGIGVVFCTIGSSFIAPAQQPACPGLLLPGHAVEPGCVAGI